MLARSIGLSITLLASASISAHHGPPTNDVLYLTDEMVEIEGQVTEVLWRNPHPRVRVSVSTDPAEAVIWDLELAPSPRALESGGFGPVDFMGRIRAAGYLSKRHADSLGVVHMLLPNGQELVQGNRDLRWSDTELDETPTAIDPAKVEAARRDATGLFRVWGRRSGLGAKLRSALYDRALTERGRRLAATFDPIRDNLELHCRQGMPDSMFDPVPLELIDDGDHILIRVQQADVERVVHMDGGEHRDVAGYSPLGYSTGRWYGGVLEVTTTHIDWPFYSVTGTPQSLEASYVERFSLADGGNLLNYSIEVTDPKIFLGTMTIDATRDWAPGIEIEPYNCAVGWGD